MQVDGKVQYPGKDVKNGNITINSDRMYHLVHADTGSVDALLQLEFSP